MKRKELFPPPKDASGKNQRNKGREERSTLSVNGRISLCRIRWYDPIRGSACPLDRLVDAAEATVSVGVRQLCCDLGVGGRSFARSCQSLKNTAQIVMSEEMLRQIVESEGKRALKLSGAEELEAGWSAGECRTRTPRGQEVSRIYVSADGVLVPTVTQAEKQKHRQRVRQKRQMMPRARRRRLKRLGTLKKGTDQRYKQIYVSALYDQSQEHRLVGVTRQDHKGLGKLLRRDAARVHLRAARERVGLVDGAACLRKHLEFLPLQEIVLDFYHLSEHVGEAGKATVNGEAQARQWIDRMLHTVRHQGCNPFFQELLDWRSGLRGGKRELANGLLNYVAQRQEMIAYDKCDEHGWDVGSGPVESMCGVTTDRIKGRGRRWDLDNAEALMVLEALHQSNLWKDYWKTALVCLN